MKPLTACCAQGAKHSPARFLKDCPSVIRVLFSNLARPGHATKRKTMKTNLPAHLFRPALTALLFALLAFARGQAQVPALVNYQGRLANPDSSPLPTADYELSFRV